MKTIEIGMYKELNNLFYKEIIRDDTMTGAKFLHSIGYKSAKSVPGSFHFSLSDQDYAWFILRWGHENH